MKRMKHPQHGFHHVYNTLEEDAMRKNGWVYDDTPEPAPAAEKVEESEESEVPAKRPYNRKVK